MPIPYSAVHRPDLPRPDDETTVGRVLSAMLGGATLGFGVFVVSPVLIPFVVGKIGAFLMSNPSIPAQAFWAVGKAIVRGADPVKAGLAAGLDGTGAALSEAFFRHMGVRPSA
jgi:hypothetical protein